MLRQISHLFISEVFWASVAQSSEQAPFTSEIVGSILATDLYRVYKKKRNLGISQEIDIVLKTKDFRRLGI
jgi:hypothetical protein